MPNEYTPVLSSVKLPSGTVYYFKDAWAREQLEELVHYTKYLGVTSTPLTDGEHINPIVINNESITAANGNIVVYGTKEFIYSGDSTTGVWQEFGDLSAILELLGSFAYVDEGEVTIAPKGSISASFSGSEQSISITYTPSGSITASFAGSQASVNVTGVPLGTVQIAEIVKSITGNYQPTGTITNTVSVTTSSLSATYVISEGTLPSLTISALNANTSISDAEQLVLFFDPTLVSFSQGTLPTYSTVNPLSSVDVSVDSTFVGDSVSIVATFNGSSTTFSGSCEIGGEISADFIGTEATLSASFTPSGTISATFSGTEETYTVTPIDDGGEG